MLGVRRVEIPVSEPRRRELLGGPGHVLIHYAMQIRAVGVDASHVGLQQNSVGEVGVGEIGGCKRRLRDDSQYEL